MVIRPHSDRTDSDPRSPHTDRPMQRTCRWRRPRPARRLGQAAPTRFAYMWRRCPIPSRPRRCGPGCAPGSRSPPGDSGAILASRGRRTSRGVAVDRVAGSVQPRPSQIEELRSEAIGRAGASALRRRRNHERRPVPRAGADGGAATGIFGRTTAPAACESGTWWGRRPDARIHPGRRRRSESRDSRGNLRSAATMCPRRGREEASRSGTPAAGPTT